MLPRVDKMCAVNNIVFFFKYKRESIMEEISNLVEKQNNRDVSGLTYILLPASIYIYVLVYSYVYEITKLNKLNPCAIWGDD